MRSDVNVNGFMDAAQDLSKNCKFITCIPHLFFSSKPATLNFFPDSIMLTSDTTNVTVPKIILPDPVYNE